MSRSLNKVTLIGNVGGDPEIRSTTTGTRVAKFSIATGRRFQGRDGQKQERTDWHRITAFGRLVDIIEQWVKKGDRIYVEGRLEYSQTQDDQGGTRYWTDIIVNEMIMLGSGTGGDGGGGGGRDYGNSNRGGSSPRGRGGPPARQGQDPPLNEPDDDLPF